MVTKEILKNAIETKWRRHQRNLQLIILGIIVTVSVLFFIPTMLFEDLSLEMLGITLLSLSPLFIVFVPCLIYYQITYIKIQAVLDDYKIYETILDHPSPSYMYKHSFYYSIEFKTDERDKISIDTPGMFGNGMIGPCSIEDYNNQRIYVAYSKKYDKTIILGKSIEGED